MIQHCFENVKKKLCLIFINKYFFPFRAVMVMIIWGLDLQLPMQPVPITTKIVSFNPAYGKMYLIQHYVIKFVSLYQVGVFLRVLQLPPPIKLTATI